MFDSARIYGLREGQDRWDGAGLAERILGRALKGRRDEIQIVTKGGVGTRRDHVSHRQGRYAEVIKDVELSLKDLGTDHIDLYLIHWPDRDVPMAETMSAMIDLRRAGKARYLGVSNFPSDLLREAAAHAPIVANQVGYNLFDRRWEREMFATAEELGIGVMAYGPLAHGLLTGTFTAETEFDGSDWRRSRVFFGQPLLTPEHLAANLRVVAELRQLAEAKGLSLAQLALAWALGGPQVSCAIVGARVPSEIEEAVAAADVEFTAEELEQIDRVMLGAAGQIDQVPQ
jgi:aryl-alcohol dehydrogenase-like predicted oxidoreductase